MDRLVPADDSQPSTTATFAMMYGSSGAASQQTIIEQVGKDNGFDKSEVVIQITKELLNRGTKPSSI